LKITFQLQNCWEKCKSFHNLVTNSTRLLKKWNLYQKPVGVPHVLEKSATLMRNSLSKGGLLEKCKYFGKLVSNWKFNKRSLTHF
jgi:hypothetical protein